MTRRLLQAFADRSPQAPTQPVEPLTDREEDVLALVARGRTNAEIAAELFVSVATVKSYVTALLAKLDAASRVQIAIRVHDAGLL